MKKLEIACLNLESALIAQENGADRVELCADIHLGGTTPTTEVVQKAKNNLSIDICIMIRPKGGDFVYSDLEFQQMKDAVLKIKPIGVDGFVFGILNEDNLINIKQNVELVNLAYPIPCTFHRALDEVENYKTALEDVITCGFSTILTSGTFSNVTKGAEVLRNLVLQAVNRITIMPGGGLRSTNISELDKIVKADFYHSSAITDRTEIANSEEIMKLKKKLSIY
ncbi:copper homeostasis protein CutC [Flavobacterium ardleyense]|uniref:PF03932 family protein CutC n=1 Tax=Flavobacterium ardleyense TaxID=2038737 RepID=A0ABW5Z626_9FLAO